MTSRFYWMLFFAVSVVVSVCVWIYFFSSTPSPAFQTYRNEALGISFSYPTSYFMEEKQSRSGERDLYEIILTDDTPENRLVREGKAPGREGPPAISVSVYQNNLDKLSVDRWIATSGFSQFKLSPDGQISPVTISGTVAALRYRWSGLYEGQSVVFGGPRDTIVSASVTYLGVTDRIVSDFEEILKTMRVSY